jgi:ATP-binding cassette subfamily B protein
VQGADQIVVLDGGRIVQQGSHDQLMARPGRYRELCERQLIRVAA